MTDCSSIRYGSPRCSIEHGPPPDHLASADRVASARGARGRVQLIEGVGTRGRIAGASRENRRTGCTRSYKNGPRSADRTGRCRTPRTEGAVQRGAMRPALGSRSCSSCSCSTAAARARRARSHRAPRRSRAACSRSASARCARRPRALRRVARRAGRPRAFPQPDPKQGEGRRERDREGAREGVGTRLSEDRPARDRQRPGREDAVAPVRAPPSSVIPSRASATRSRSR
jgi:hypothetical protein